jgi:hypothetical protein
VCENVIRGRADSASRTRHIIESLSRIEGKVDVMCVNFDGWISSPNASNSFCMIEMRWLGRGSTKKPFRRDGSDVTEGQLKLGGSAVNRGVSGGVGLAPGTATNLTAVSGTSPLPFPSSSRQVPTCSYRGALDVGASKNHLAVGNPPGPRCIDR